MCWFSIFNKFKGLVFICFSVIKKSNSYFYQINTNEYQWSYTIKMVFLNNNLMVNLSDSCIYFLLVSLSACFPLSSNIYALINWFTILYDTYYLKHHTLTETWYYMSRYERKNHTRYTILKIIFMKLLKPFNLSQGITYFHVMLVICLALL